MRRRHIGSEKEQRLRRLVYNRIFHLSRTESLNTARITRRKWNGYMSDPSPKYHLRGGSPFQRSEQGPDALRIMCGRCHDDDDVA